MTTETVSTPAPTTRIAAWKVALHGVFAALSVLLVTRFAALVTAPFVFLGAGAYISALLVVAVAVLSAAAVVGFRLSRSRGALLLAPVGMVPALVQPLATLGSWSEPGTLLVATLAAVASVVLCYPGVTRLVGGGLAACALVVGIVSSDTGSVSEASAAGFPGSMRPQVTEVHGYVEVGAIPTPLHGIVVEYASSDGDKRFTLSTEPIVESDTAADIDQVCMIPLDLTDYDAESDAISCEVTPNGWQKISATRRELSERRGPMIVRAGSDLSVDVSVLRAALFNAEDASNRQYREFLKESRPAE